MTDRILDFSEGAAYLRLRLDQLVIERKDQPETTTPLNEIASLILTHPQATCSQPVLARLMALGGTVVVCDNTHQPVGMMLPIVGHGTQTERLAAQADAAQPLKKRLWKQIVQMKIRAQGELLKQLHGNDHGLFAIAQTVQSGDVSNREAVASRRYWPALFTDPTFQRRFDAPDANRLLNYGYAVLRAVVGRAICGAGLHPSLGLHHHNRYNAFCLADDLMEPYRPLVDAVVVEHTESHGRDAPLDRAGKEALLGAILRRYRADGEVRTLFDLCASTAVSLAKAYMKQSNQLDYPNRLTDAGE